MVVYISGRFVNMENGPEFLTNDNTEEEYEDFYRTDEDDDVEELFLGES